MNERLDYLFVIINSFGQCWIVRDNSTEKSSGLASLVSEGWRPTRETAFQDSQHVLITLEREARAPRISGSGTHDPDVIVGARS